MNRIVLILIALVAVASLAMPASARPHHQPRHAAPATAGQPGQHQYIVIQDFNPRLFDSAARTARDAVRLGNVADFRIILAARGVLLAIPPITTVQRGVSAILRANPRIHLIACREVVTALASAAHRQPPLLPGTQVLPCDGLHAAMERAGWESAPGF
jgi:hypothetical protein